jgi:hypothetical protein
LIAVMTPGEARRLARSLVDHAQRAGRSTKGGR